MRAPEPVRRGVATAVGLLLLTGCVQAPASLTPLPERADLPPHPVRVVTPSGAPDWSGTGGALDESGLGVVTVLQGWVPAEQAELLVVSPEPLRVVEGDRQRRPDAAAAVGATGPDLGFRLVLRGERAPSSVCLLYRTEQQTSVVTGSDTAACG